MDTDALKDEARAALAAASGAKALASWHAAWLGRSGGKVTALLRTLGEKTLEEKQSYGPRIQALKAELEEAYGTAERKMGADAANAHVDMTVPGIAPQSGHLHPLTLVENEVRRIFSAMNFGIVEGPELETEKYNFDALNFPKHHPARDMQDTLWVSSAKGLLMRTHTSPVQARYMERHLPPVRIVVPGRVFRNEATDASHEANFYQFEGLMVGEDVTLANMKWVIAEFCRQFFKRSVEVRFRPSFFPFTEPSVEVDIRMDGDAWLEVMGGGMVHPNVLSGVKYDPKKVQGFAFGGGLDRFAMLKYGIPDVRLFYQNDLRFISQF